MTITSKPTGMNCTFLWFFKRIFYRNSFRDMVSPICYPMTILCWFVEKLLVPHCNNRNIVLIGTRHPLSGPSPSEALLTANKSILWNLCFLRLLHYFTVSLTGSAFEERSSSSADIDCYDQFGCSCYYSYYRLLFPYFLL